MRSSAITRVAVVGCDYWGAKRVHNLSTLPGVEAWVIGIAAMHLGQARRDSPAAWSWPVVQFAALFTSSDMSEHEIAYLMTRRARGIGSSRVTAAQSRPVGETTQAQQTLIGKRW